MNGNLNCNFFFLFRSAGCVDPRGMRMVFIVHQGSDRSPLWRVTTRIACIRVDPVTRQIDRHQVLSLRQFNNVFKTIQGHVSVRSEAQLERVITIITMVGFWMWEWKFC